MSTTDAAIRARWVVTYNIQRGLLATARHALAGAERGLAWARKHKRKSAKHREWEVSLLRRKVALREQKVAEAKRVIDRHTSLPLRLKAYKVAEGLVGVMEHGGNNAGPMVSKIIRENGGTGPEPWCGDGMAYCYRHAGSKRVQRAWASVPMLRGLVGIKATGHPVTGDLVRFEFTGDRTPDHVGMFVKDLGNGLIETIEFNTGASGAVSDSTTGGDGVYRKRRAKTLVRDYLHVLG